MEESPVKTITKLASVSISVLALHMAAPAFAQGALIGSEALDDRIDDIQRDVGDELARSQDAQRFGNNQYAQGWTGNMSLGFAATSGNTDTTDLSIGGRFRYGDGKPRAMYP